jgi:hypothetical protein
LQLMPFSRYLRVKFEPILGDQGPCEEVCGYKSRYLGPYGN